MVPLTSAADDVRGDAAAEASSDALGVDPAGYPERWSIKSFLSGHARQATTVARRTAPVHAAPRIRSSLRDDSRAAYAQDRTSLAGRLQQLSALKSMTVWQGRRQAIVVGLQNGRYFGLSIAEAERDDD